MHENKWARLLKSSLVIYDRRRLYTHHVAQELTVLVDRTSVA